MTTSTSKRRRYRDNRPKYRLMRRLWNDGDSSLSDIADIVGMPVDRVERWLVKQPGWPNIIRGRVVICRCCKVPFEVWVSGTPMHCSAECREETRRRQFWRSAQRRRGIAEPGEPPPRNRSRRGSRMSNVDRLVIDKAGREARERGTTRDVVLAEWKFVPQRSKAA